MAGYNGRRDFEKGDEMYWTHSGSLNQPNPVALPYDTQPIPSGPQHTPTINERLKNGDRHEHLAQSFNELFTQPFEEMEEQACSPHGIQLEAWELDGLRQSQNTNSHYFGRSFDPQSSSLLGPTSVNISSQNTQVHTRNDRYKQQPAEGFRPQKVFGSQSSQYNGGQAFQGAHSHSTLALDVHQLPNLLLSQIPLNQRYSERQDHATLNEPFSPNQSQLLTPLASSSGYTAQMHPMGSAGLCLSQSPVSSMNLESNSVILGSQQIQGISCPPQGRHLFDSHQGSTVQSQSANWSNMNGHSHLNSPLQPVTTDTELMAKKRRIQDTLIANEVDSQYQMNLYDQGLGSSAATITDSRSKSGQFKPPMKNIEITFVDNSRPVRTRRCKRCYAIDCTRCVSKAADPNNCTRCIKDGLQIDCKRAIEVPDLFETGTLASWIARFKRYETLVNASVVPPSHATYLDIRALTESQSPNNHIQPPMGTRVDFQNLSNPECKEITNILYELLDKLWQQRAEGVGDSAQDADESTMDDDKLKLQCQRFLTCMTCLRCLSLSQINSHQEGAFLPTAVVVAMIRHFITTAKRLWLNIWCSVKQCDELLGKTSKPNTLRRYGNVAHCLGMIFQVLQSFQRQLDGDAGHTSMPYQSAHVDLIGGGLKEVKRVGQCFNEKDFEKGQRTALKVSGMYVRILQGREDTLMRATSMTWTWTFSEVLNNLRNDRAPSLKDLFEDQDFFNVVPESPPKRDAVQPFQHSDACEFNAEQLAIANLKLKILTLEHNIAHYKAEQRLLSQERQHRVEMERLAARYHVQTIEQVAVSSPLHSAGPLTPPDEDVDGLKDQNSKSERFSLQRLSTAIRSVRDMLKQEKSTHKVPNRHTYPRRGRDSFAAKIKRAFPDITEKTHEIERSVVNITGTEMAM